jgi:ABC-type sugar transport system ATPase subunit
VEGQPPVAVSSVFVARFGVHTKGGRLIMGLRPTELSLLPEHEESKPVDALRGTVWAVEALGRHTWVTVDIGPQRIRVKTGPHVHWLAGMTVRLAFDPLQTLSFDAETGVLNEPAATP